MDQVIEEAKKNMLPPKEAIPKDEIISNLLNLIYFRLKSAQESGKINSEVFLHYL